MAKAKRKPSPNAGIILGCVLYGGILGYAIGQAQAEKAAIRRAEKLETSRRLREMEAALHKLQHPEAYDEHGRLKPMATMMGFNMGGLE